MSVEVDPVATVTEPPAPPGDSTAADPTAGAVWRSVRGPALVVLGLVLLGVLAGLAESRQPPGALDPRAADPSGSLAVAELLRARDVPVDRQTQASATVSGAGPGVTVVLPYPERVSARDLRALARSGADVVAVGADAAVLAALGPQVETAGEVAVEPRQPACALPAARTAGDADTGGSAYSVEGDALDGRTISRCYASGGDATLLHIAGSEALADRGSLALLGSGAALQNASLDERGNAALALGLLGGQDRVLWLVPRVGDAAGATGRGGVADVLPEGVLLAVVQLFIAAALLMYARGRRLGRVVPEPLPVVVRAAETVEGLGRLYRAAGARDRAGEALRAGARARLGPALGIAADAGPDALTTAVALRSRASLQDIGGLLYGPDPDDDADLVRLADDLDALTASVLRERGSTRPAAATSAPADTTSPAPSTGGPTA